MRIDLITIANKAPNWVNQGYQDYSQRLKDPSLHLIEIPLQKRTNPNQLAQHLAKESEQILKACQNAQYIVILDSSGKSYTSEQLAQRLLYWQSQAQRLALIIGGPEGLSPTIKARAHESWSLGSLTLPHPLVRIVAAEALYRAHSINQNHPYHRA